MKLDLTSCSLTGAIPACFGQLSGLQKILLRGNKLSGPVPPEIGQLANLEMLSLGSNSLTGTIPEALGELGKLREMYLYGNKLSGSLPECFSAMGSLEIMKLSNGYMETNKFESDMGIPASWSTMASLKEINIASLGLRGPLPACLGDLKKLTLLNAHDNKLDATKEAKDALKARLPRGCIAMF